MSRYTGPRNKRARAVGQDLGLKSNPLKVAKRLNILPGQHGAKGRRKTSDFGIQLKEKQKLKYIYGLNERQLRKVYAAAATSTKNTGEELLVLLERRLDNVIYRLGWAPTRAAARQLVGHGHVKVNQEKVSIPSYQCRMTELISLSTKGTSIPHVEAAIKGDSSAPAWMEKKSGVGKIVRLPEQADITETVTAQLVVEYYSR